MKTRPRPLFFTLVSLLLLTALLACPAPARADSTITVDSTADDTNSDGQCTLREAITNANDDASTYGDCTGGSGDDTILFDGSLGSATITLSSTLPTISDDNNLTLDGDNRITISGANSYRVFYVTGNFTLQNITITNGMSSGGYSGGGAMIYGTMTITHSTFSNNQATNNGGGLWNGGTLTITGSTFSGNSTTNDGGGINNGGTLTVANTTVTDNTANYGAGLMNNGGTATILNSTIYGNTANLSNGGLSAYNGGVAPTTTIYNTILAGNTGGDCWNHEGYATLNGGSNLIGVTTTCTSIASTSAGPNLGSLAGSPAYFPLNNGSPAIDAGDDTQCAASPANNESQNGVTRPADGDGNNTAVCDIGSYEVPDTFPPTVVSIIRANPNPTYFSSVKFTVTFSEAVTDVDNADFTLSKTGTITGMAIDTVSGSGATRTVRVKTGTGSGTLRLDIPVTASITDMALNPISGLPHIGDQAYNVKRTMVFRSAGALDGWVLESSENSSAGGSKDSTATNFYLGDDAADKQYRSILSFDTSGLPDSAAVTKVTLKIKLQGTTGTTPYDTHGTLLVDVYKGAFSGSNALQILDFNAAASKNNVGSLPRTPVAGWHTKAWGSGILPYINLGGITQLRLRFQEGDNDDMSADYLRFYSGNAAITSRPQLIVEFVIP